MIDILVFLTEEDLPAGDDFLGILLVPELFRDVADAANGTDVFRKFNKGLHFFRGVSRIGQCGACFTEPVEVVDGRGADELAQDVEADFLQFRVDDHFISSLIGIDDPGKKLAGVGFIDVAAHRLASERMPQRAVFDSCGQGQ